MHACLLVSECMRVWVLAGRATGGHREVHRGRPCAGCDVPMKRSKQIRILPTIVSGLITTHLLVHRLQDVPK